MTNNLEAFQSLLLGMRERFLDELPERCDGFDNLILALENAPDDREAFNELFRGVHSLKGSGGTHGLPILTTVCHHLENLLTDTAEHGRFDKALASNALAYVDMLRRVEPLARQANPDFAPIEASLGTLRQATQQTRTNCLIAESSAVMTHIYRQALGDLPINLTLTGNGLDAIERLVRESFDFAIIGGELKELNGIAVIHALRASHANNRDIPLILVSSSRDPATDSLKLAAILPRDQKLAQNLVTAIRPLLAA